MRELTPKRGDAVEALMIAGLTLATFVQAAGVIGMAILLFR